MDRRITMISCNASKGKMGDFFFAIAGTVETESWAIISAIVPIDLPILLHTVVS